MLTWIIYWYISCLLFFCLTSCCTYTWILQSHNIDTISIKAFISLSICCIHLFIPQCFAFANVILKCLSIHFTERERESKGYGYSCSDQQQQQQHQHERSMLEEELWGNDAIDTSLRYSWLVPRRFPFTFPWLLYIVVPIAWLNCFWPACLPRLICILGYTSWLDGFASFAAVSSLSFTLGK